MREEARERRAAAREHRAMPTLEEFAQRVERLLLRHDELKRTNALLEQQLATVTAERDSMRSRLAAARARIDALLERLPREPSNPPGDRDTA
jgi:chromosome segregation ATPase